MKAAKKERCKRRTTTFIRHSTICIPSSENEKKKTTREEVEAIQKNQFFLGVPSRPSDESIRAGKNRRRRDWLMVGGCIGLQFV